MSTYKEAPLYGADVQGSLMGDGDCSGWHLDRLDTILSQCAGKALGGITRAMLYFGSWRAMFAWHKEDLDLYSINYLHGGAPKLWYAVPPPLAGRFEAMADGWFPQERMRCKEYLRHKTCMMSPSVLKSSNIAYHTASKCYLPVIHPHPKAQPCAHFHCNCSAKTRGVHHHISQGVSRGLQRGSQYRRGNQHGHGVLGSAGQGCQGVQV